MRFVVALTSAVLLCADSYQLKAVKHSSIYEARRSLSIHLKVNIEDSYSKRSRSISMNHIPNLLTTINKESTSTSSDKEKRAIIFKNIFHVASCTLLVHILNQVSPIQSAHAIDSITAIAPTSIPSTSRLSKDSIDIPTVDFGQLKVPYEHVNLEFKQFLGKKATIVFNMKIDDPQTILQFPDIIEIYKRYKSQGLNVMAFPTEQGWFEPDDDETCRAKAKEFYGFGDYPHAVVFDKVYCCM